MELDGQEYYAHIVVREAMNGDIYYDNNLTSVEKIGGRDVDATRTKSGAAPVSTDRTTLDDWWRSVNGMTKAILFQKAKPIASNPGLALQTLTDKRGHPTKRWKRTMQEQPKGRAPAKADEGRGMMRPRAPRAGAESCSWSGT